MVQRETLDPASYVELWLKDSGQHGGPEYAERYDTWLWWFEQTGIEGVGFGWLNVRLGGSGTQDLLEWPYDVEQPIGPAVHAWGRATVALHDLPDDVLLATRLTVRSDVQQETVGPPGAEDPEAVVLVQQRGFRRAPWPNTDTGADELMTTYLPAVRELVGEGFLEVSGDTS